MRRTSAFALFTAALLLAAPARAEDAPKMKRISNPEFENWSQFAVGAFVELTTESETNGNKSSSKMVHKLVELTKEKAVVETTMVLEGVPAEFAPKPTKREVPKEVEVPEKRAPEDERPQYRTKEGEETIDVAGTSMKCKTSESTVEGEGMTTLSKTWMSKDVPGMLAKTEQTTEGKMGDQVFKSVVRTTVTKWAAK